MIIEQAEAELIASLNRLTSNLTQPSQSNFKAWLEQIRSKLESGTSDDKKTVCSELSTAASAGQYAGLHGAQANEFNRAIDLAIQLLRIFI